MADFPDLSNVEIQTNTDLNIDKIKDFFDNYVKTYLPFKNEKIYEVLMDYLVDNFLKNSYDEIPTDFKQLYEQNELIPSVYDQILVALGVPDNVISKLMFDEKLIFLKTIPDFIKYKGTVKLFQNIGEAFSDKLDIAELYVDFDEESLQWILKPYTIYNGAIVPVETSVKIYYDDVYNKVPGLLISIEDLEVLKTNNNAIFPIKTNLMLLDYNIVSYSQPMCNLVISTILKQYGNDSITVYMDDETFKVSLIDLYFIWYYVISEYYSSDFHKIDIVELLDFTYSANPYSMKDLPELFKLYDNITTVNEASTLYNKLFGNFFQKIFKSNTVTYADMFTTFKTFNPNFAEYIKIKLEETTIEDRTRTFINITNKLYESLLIYYGTVSYYDILFSKYFNILLESLPQLILDPIETTSYILLYNFKPFHVEFISRMRNIIVSDDKFNTVTPDIKQNVLTTIFQLNFLSEFDMIYNFALTYFKTTDIVLSSTYRTTPTHCSIFNYLLTDNYIKNAKLYYNSAIEISEIIDKTYSYNKLDSIEISSQYKLNSFITDTIDIFGSIIEKIDMYVGIPLASVQEISMYEQFNYIHYNEIYISLWDNFENVIINNNQYDVNLTDSFEIIID